MKKRVIALILALAIGSSASVSAATCTKTPAESVKSVKAALASAVANSQCGVLLGKISAASSCNRQSNTANKNCSANSKSACNVSSCPAKPANSENTYSAASVPEKASCSSKSLSKTRSASNAKSGNQRTCSSSSCGSCNYSGTCGKMLNDIFNSFCANFGFCGNTSKAAPEPSSSASSSSTSNSYSTFQNEVVQLVNAERKKAGLSGLAENAPLMKTATVKSEDMAKNNYFSHTSPTYGSPFDLMKKFGISYRAAGENIAMGQETPEQVMKAWMNSPGHRENILNPSFTKIGVGVAKNSENQYYWTQHFIG